MTDKMNDNLINCSPAEQAFTFRVAASVLGVVAGETQMRASVDSQFAFRVAGRVMDKVLGLPEIQEAAEQSGITPDRAIELRGAVQGLLTKIVRPEFELSRRVVTNG